MALSLCLDKGFERRYIRATARPIVSLFSAVVNSAL